VSGEDLSVIVPTRNHRNYIRECLKPLILQREAPAEIVVLDCESKDNTLEIVGENFPSVRVVKAPRETGLSNALNLGIRETGRSFLSIVFPEVKLDKGYFQAVLAELEKPENAKAGIATGKIYRMFGGHRVLDSAGLEFGGGRLLPGRRAEGERDQGRYDEAGLVFGAPRGAAVYRRRVLEDLAEGGEIFDESLTGVLEDVDLAWRAHRKGWSALYVPGATAFRDAKGEGRGTTYGDALRWEFGRRAVLLKNARTRSLFWSIPALVVSDAAAMVREPASCIPLLFSAALVASRWMEIRRKRQAIQKT